MAVKDFLKLITSQGEHPPNIHQDLDPLLEEATLALADDNVGAAITRMETILSTTHKLILQLSPSGPLLRQHPAIDEPEVRTPKAEARVTVLIVDDEVDWLHSMKDLLAYAGFDVVAVQSSKEALQAMVEHKFDLVITDLMMGPMRGAYQMDGRELVIAAKKSSTKTKVLVLTAFGGMSAGADLFGSGADVVLSKLDSVFGPDGIINTIKVLTSRDVKPR